MILKIKSRPPKSNKIKLLSKIHRKNNKELQRGITITVLILWPFFFWSSNNSSIWTFMQNMLRFQIILIKLCRKKYTVHTTLTFYSIYNLVTLKIRSRSPKSNHFFHPDDVSVLIWSNSSHWLKWQCAHKPFTAFLQRAIIPREWAPSPYFLLCRYNLLISMCHISLFSIKIWVSKCQCDLENEVQVTKI